MQCNDFMLEFSCDFCGECSDMSMIQCPTCRGKSIVYSRANKHERLTDLYCICKDPECNVKFVVEQSVKKILTPSVNHGRQLVIELLRSIPKSELEELLSHAQST